MSNFCDVAPSNILTDLSVRGLRSRTINRRHSFSNQPPQQETETVGSCGVTPTALSQMATTVSDLKPETASETEIQLAGPPTTGCDWATIELDSPATDALSSTQPTETRQTASTDIFTLPLPQTEDGDERRRWQATMKATVDASKKQPTMGSGYPYRRHTHAYRSSYVPNARRPSAERTEPSDLDSVSDTEKGKNLRTVDSTDVTDVLKRLEVFEGTISAIGRQMDDMWNQQIEVADQLRSHTDRERPTAAAARGGWDEIPADVLQQISDQIGQCLIADGKIKSESADDRLTRSDGTRFKQQTHRTDYDPPGDANRYDPSVSSRKVPCTPRTLYND